MYTCVQWSVRSGPTLTRPAPGYEYQSPPVPRICNPPNLPSPGSRHRQHSAGPAWPSSMEPRVMQQLFITEYPTYCLPAAPHSAHRSDLNNPTQPWPKCCLLTVIVERKWIDGIWSAAQGFLVREVEDVGNCSRCIFYRLKIGVHRLLVQARLLAASDDPVLWTPGTRGAQTSN